MPSELVECRRGRERWSAHRPLTHSLDYGKEQAVEQHTCEASGCDQITKVCVECTETKPLTEYHRRSRGKDGHRNNCKQCAAALKKAWHEEHREEQNALQNKWYWANVDENRAKSRAYGRANREAETARAKAWRTANRERYMASVWAWREANPDKYWDYMKKYHAEKWASDPAYRERHNAKKVRRSRLLSEAVHEPYTRESVFERDGWVCQLCNEVVDPELQWPDPRAVSVDHIVPLSLGGDDTPANVQTAHIGCNSRKGNRAA